MFRLWPIASLALTLVALDARAAGDQQEGQRIAERWCKRCHVVGTENRHGGIDSTPSFFLMHDKLDDYRQRIQSFKQRRPHKSLEFDDVSKDDLEDLLVYIGGLERPQ